MKNEKVAESDALDICLSVLFSVATFLILVGPDVLNCQNIAWLHSGNDPEQNYLTWAFFRTSQWSIPPGLNPAFGMGVSSSIFYSDGDSLLCIFFKILNTLHLIQKVPFQFFGIWILICFIGQGIFSNLLLKNFDVPRLGRFLLVGMFLFMPPFLWRLSQHYTLLSHWLILASLFLCTKKPARADSLLWGTVLILSVMIHPYFVLINGVLWFSDIIKRRFLRSLNVADACKELTSISLLIVFILWVIGFFSMPTGQSVSGFGFYKANLLTFINPSGWSYVLPELPSSGPGEYEGFNYLGLGSLVIIMFALLALVLKGRNAISIRRERKPMFVALILMGLWALSNRISLGDYTVSIPLPHFLSFAAGIARASGRFLWPADYVILLSCALICIRLFRYKHVLILFFACFLIQLVDTSRAWSALSGASKFTSHFHLSGEVWPNKLRSKFWATAAIHYKKLAALPIVNAGEHWEDLAKYALDAGMETNAIYFARVDEVALSGENRRWIDLIEKGSVGKDVLMILEPSMLSLALLSSKNKNDLFALVDDLYVYAPSWYDLEAAPAVEVVAITPTSYFQPFENEKIIKFSKSENGIPFLTSGWGLPEGWGVWSTEKIACLDLPNQQGFEREKVLSLTIQGLVYPDHPEVTVKVRTSNNTVIGQLDLENPKIQVDIPIGSHDYFKKLDFQFVRVCLEINNLSTPSEIGGSEYDNRKLGIGLINASFKVAR